MKISMLAAATALFALIALVPRASAAADPVAGGSATVKLNNGFFKKLKKNKVRVLKLAPGTVKGKFVTLPVSGGALDPTNGQGTLNLGGGLKLKHGKRQAPVRALVLDTTSSSLTAKVAGKNMRFASVSGYSFTRAGFGVNVNVSKLRLTGKAAKQLNKKLGFSGKKKGKKGKKGKRKKVKPLLKGKMTVGSVAGSETPASVTVLPSGASTLTADPGTIGKFVSKGFNPLTGDIAPIAPATQDILDFQFPITGGSIALDGSGGQLQTSGGLRLQPSIPSPGLVTTMSDPIADLSTKALTVLVDIEPSPPGPGFLDRSSVADLDLSGATIAVDPVARTISVSGAVVKLQELAATTLNTVYPGGTDFVAGDPLGTISFTAQTQ